MAELDFGKRLRSLEEITAKQQKQLERQQHQLEILLARQQWVPLSQAAQQLGVSATVIYNRIRNGRLIKGKHWKLNGNRYQINALLVDQELN